MNSTITAVGLGVAGRADQRRLVSAYARQFPLQRHIRQVPARQTDQRPGVRQQNVDSAAWILSRGKVGERDYFRETVANAPPLTATA